ncbi:hypothetical protein DPMN_013078 [Dreissena polymorpha]|uniref:Uncharacterized protein n=1 Tax=Dreissena polymorpha TaxID=45954 RepID=A0A9D4N989_DREPO|nr:hypothetical protein DPMN_013078 [Dreissena polymorpha]
MAIQLHLATLEMLLVLAEHVSALKTTTDLETTHVVQNCNWDKEIASCMAAAVKLPA